MYYKYAGKICPICGCHIKRPYTGQVTYEQLQEDIDTCLWIEVIDESRSTVGYVPYCKGKSNVN